MAEVQSRRNARKLAFIGSGLITLGTTLPIISVPFKGNLNLFNLGAIYGLIVLVLAIVAAGLVQAGRLKHVLWPGLVAVALLIYGLVEYQSTKSKLRAQVEAELQGNPLRGLAEMAIDAMYLQWGWVPIAVGAGLLIYAGILGRKTPVEQTAKDFD